ncbi:MAG: NF038104 family lipoprotein [Neisseria sp.]|nr:NF038104 family lipoprotein [Neisseria sp.]
MFRFRKAALRLPLLFALVLPLQGCLVASAVDLAATTVFTAGKLVVKGTGAIIEAAIPDGDDDEKPKPKAKKSEPQTDEAEVRQIEISVQLPPDEDMPSEKWLDETAQ